jgi:hypothetical protein
MKYREFMFKLGAFYKQPAMDKTPLGDIPNLQYSEAFEWTETTVPEASLYDFYKAILLHFSPTATTPFPTPKNLADIWVTYCMKSPEQQPFQQIDHVEKFEAAKLSAKEKAAIKWQDVYADDGMMDPKDLLKKYGRELCSEIWIALGAWGHDNLHKFVDHKDFMAMLKINRPDSKKIAPYIEQAKKMKNPVFSD